MCPQAARPHPRTRALVIVNPTAGRGRARALLRHALPSYLVETGLAFEIFRTSAPGDAARRVRAGGDFDHILVAGGDGTLNEVICEAPEERPIGILPLGTSNSVARELEIPRDLAGALAVFRRGTVRRIDLGVLFPGAAASRRFALCVSAGFDAAVIHALARRRRGAMHIAAYLLHIFKCLRRYRYPPIRVLADGELLPAGCSQVVVTNTRHYGFPMRISERVAIDNGRLQVVAMYPRGPLSILRYILAAVRGRIENLPDVHTRPARRVRLEAASAEVPCQVDGEPCGRLPVEIGVAPGAALMIVPENEMLH